MQTPFPERGKAANASVCFNHEQMFQANTKYRVTFLCLELVICHHKCRLQLFINKKHFSALWPTYKTAP